MHAQLIDTLAILFGLTLLHVAADVIPQTEQEAVRKAKSGLIRAMHCLKYTVVMLLGVLAYALVCGMTSPVLFFPLAGIWIFATHFCEDTYWLPMMWAKHCRRASEFATTVWDAETGKERLPTDDEAMYSFCKKPIGLLLVIWVDQFIHVVSLIPVAAYMASR